MTRLLNLALCSVLALVSNGAVSQAKPADDSTIVDLGYAKLQGYYNSTAGASRWLGIKYAEAPIGELRFQAPKPLVADVKTTVINSTTYAPQCYQWGISGYSLSSPNTGSSEDCLYLDIYLPRGATPKQKKKLPVLFWIYGGAWASGSSATYRPDHLYTDAASDFIFVGINYRLGPLGFLGGKEMKTQAVINAGLLDQQQALRWVQQNIQQFGGDPKRVTIFGESAGASSVLNQAVANGGETRPALFQNAIAMSPFEGPARRYDSKLVQNQYDGLVNATGCYASNDTVECLAGLEIDKLVTAFNGVVAKEPIGAFIASPMIDGDFIQDRPTRLLSQGLSNVDKLWVNMQRVESVGPNGLTFYPTNLTSEAELRLWLNQTFGYTGTQIDRVLAAYPADQFANLTIRTQKLYSDSNLGCAALDFAFFQPRPSYLSEMVIPGNDRHGEDVKFYFLSGAFNTPLADEAAIFRHYIVSFATKNGDIGLAAWPKIRVDLDTNGLLLESPTQKIFNVTETSRQPANEFALVNPVFEARCAFWRTLRDETDSN